MMSETHAATWGIAATGDLRRDRSAVEFAGVHLGGGRRSAVGLLNLLPWPDALAAAAKGTDVYFFLIGMMLLAEVARQEGLFDWLAAQAVRHSHGSAKRLFLIVYVVGTVVTVLLSNDATAVVLTPAVYAATRAAKVEPLPYLFICAFIANAASFVLPISNPANLVVFGTQMPPLSEWLRTFALPSVASIVATYGVLRLTQRRALDAGVAAAGEIAPLRRGGKLAAVGNRADGGRAAGGLGAGLGSRIAHFHRRRDRHRARSADRAAVAAAGAERHFMVRAAAGGRPVHPGRRLEPHRRVAGAGAGPEAGLDDLAAAHLLDRGFRRRHRIEPREQSADGFDCGDHQSNRRGVRPTSPAQS